MRAVRKRYVGHLWFQILHHFAHAAYRIRVVVWDFAHLLLAVSHPSLHVTNCFFSSCVIDSIWFPSREFRRHSTITMTRQNQCCYFANLLCFPTLVSTRRKICYTGGGNAFDRDIVNNFCTTYRLQHGTCTNMHDCQRGITIAPVPRSPASLAGRKSARPDGAGCVGWFVHGGDCHSAPFRGKG